MLENRWNCTTAQGSEPLQCAAEDSVATAKPDHLAGGQPSFREAPGLGSRADGPVPASISGASPRVAGRPHHRPQHFLAAYRRAQTAQHLSVGQVLFGAVGAIVRVSVATLLDRRSSNTSGARVEVEEVPAFEVSGQGSVTT